MGVRIINWRSRASDIAEYAEKLVDAGDNVAKAYYLILRNPHVCYRSLSGYKLVKTIDLSNVKVARVADPYTDPEWVIIAPSLHSPLRAELYRDKYSEDERYVIIFRKTRAEAARISIPPQTVFDAMNILVNGDAVATVKDQFSVDELARYIDTLLEMRTVINATNTTRVQKEEFGNPIALSRTPPSLYINLKGKKIEYVTATVKPYRSIQFYNIAVYVHMRGRLGDGAYVGSGRVATLTTADELERTAKILMLINGERELEVFHKVSKELFDLVSRADVLFNAWKKVVSD